MLGVRVLGNVAAACFIEHTPMELSVPMLRCNQIPAEATPRVGQKAVFAAQQVRSHRFEVHVSARRLQITIAAAQRCPPGGPHDPSRLSRCSFGEGGW